MIIIPIVLAYLIGSIPNAVWIGKVFYGRDVRNEGSKNAGATNVIRVLGLKPGIIVLVLDLLKGVVPLALLPFFFEKNNDYFYVYQIIIAVATVIGHVFPIFAGFRGGKGVATLVGVLIMLFPQVFLIVAGIFFGTFFLSRYVSLASMCAAISLPLLQFAFFQFDKLPLLIFAILIAVFVPLTHIKNIKRLIRGEEPKFVFKKHSTD
ncbi:MAG: glycerol-3-phosphate 1-O-acyltransferase PlsY [Bacteroidales bacterium]|nr:glycerol-3-phosphate 1-O-acyltransferase PlsY [Bacteroidales bacterium]